MTSHEGGCNCGSVRYRVRGEPLVTGICHCTLCRKESGSAFVFYAEWPIGDFTVTGDFATHEGRSFCPRCGSRLFNLTETIAEIRLGSLDAAPTSLRPTREGWIKRREHWLVPVEGTEQFIEDPVGPEKTKQA
jgi:hypothetical protein